MHDAVDGNVDAGIGAIEQALDDQQDGLPDGLWHVGCRAIACGEGDGDGIGTTEGDRPGLPRPQGDMGAPRVGKQIVGAGRREPT